MPKYTRIGFLGCGKIGGAMLDSLSTFEDVSVSFIQVRNDRSEQRGVPVITEQSTSLLAQTDLMVESATADILKQNFDGIIQHCDIMVFSETAFSDAAFEEHALTMAKRYGRSIYLPHGAILGIDGIADGRELLNEVSITTTKSPQSLGRADIERTTVYEGSTREACVLFPRNVNVHATVALAGIGFDRTRSVIISDPSVTTNTHVILLKGDGIHFKLDITSYSTGGVTGRYTPFSACASLKRVLMCDGAFKFV